MQYDLQRELGISLSLLWRSRRWRELLTYIEQLPNTSRFAAAMATDEEYIAEVLRMHGGKLPESDGRPPLYEWTPEVAKLAEAVDELRGIAAILISVNSKPGSKAPDPKPVLRPLTAAAKLMSNMRLDRHRKLTARLLGNRSAGEPPSEG